MTVGSKQNKIYRSLVYRFSLNELPEYGKTRIKLT